MPRSFCIPGAFFVFAAFVLLFLVSISLPYLNSLDIVRTRYNTGLNAGTFQGAISELRLGIWAYCADGTNGDRTCSSTGHGYNVGIKNPETNSSIVIGASWTRGLAVHPVAAAVAFIAFLLSLSTHLTVTLLASMASFLAALLTLIAFAIDIALLVWSKHEQSKLSVSESTYGAPGFWMTFAALILLLLGGCTVCFGRRRDRLSGASSYPMTQRNGFLSRFRRN